jgi:hypothetical protein
MGQNQSNAHGGPEPDSETKVDYYKLLGVDRLVTDDE